MEDNFYYFYQNKCGHSAQYQTAHPLSNTETESKTKEVHEHKQRPQQQTNKQINKQTNKQTAATNTVVLCVHIKKLQKSSYRNRRQRDTKREKNV